MSVCLCVCVCACVCVCVCVCVFVWGGCGQTRLCMCMRQNDSIPKRYSLELLTELFCLLFWDWGKKFHSLYQFLHSLLVPNEIYMFDSLLYIFSRLQHVFIY
ncbi:hypothetical protein AMTRI_Chr03g147700 [Amborella trichopoda]